MNLRTVTFASARSYFVITLLLLACYATSFIAAYLLPAALVSLAASGLFLGAGLLFPRNQKSIDPRSESRPQASGMPTASTILARGEQPAERN